MKQEIRELAQQNKMQDAQEETVGKTDSLLRTINSEQERMERDATYFLACAQEIVRSRKTSKADRRRALEHMRSYKAAEATAGQLSRQAVSMRKMRDTVTNMDINRQIVACVQATKEFTQAYTLDPDKVAAITDAAQEAQEDAAETRQLIDAAFSGTGSTDDDDETLWLELQELLQKPTDGVQVSNHTPPASRHPLDLPSLKSMPRESVSPEHSEKDALVMMSTN
jgi:hypothetical protein